jgi:hypothetical protein
MTLSEIKAAVEAGRTVCWHNSGYRVIKDNLGQWLIIFIPNQHCVGLTWRDGVTLNGKPEEFYIEEAV